MRIFTIGPLRVEGPNGEDLTPRNTGPQCLLAILASSPDVRRSREWLQAKIWSDRFKEQASGSFRQALYSLRKSLGEAGNCVVGDGTMLWLDRSSVWVDRYDGDLVALFSQSATDAPELLHGLSSSDSEFQNWIRDERAEFERQTEPLRVQAKRRTVTNRPWLVLLAPQASTVGDGAFHARVVADAIAGHIKDQGFADVVDGPRAGVGIGLRVEAVGGAGHSVLHVSLREPLTDTMLWSVSQPVYVDGGERPDTARLDLLINQAADIAAFQIGMLSKERGGESATTLGIEAVGRMFRSGLDDLDVADTLLDQAYEQTGRGIFLAWQAYRETFLVGEHLADRSAQRDKVRELIARAIELEQYNSTVLALASYTACFVLEEYRTGLELAERSLSYNARNPLGRIHLARALSYLGDHGKAYEEATRACQMAGPGPYRYVFDFIAGVAAVMVGRREEAMRHHETVRLMKPGFRAARRQLFALYGIEGMTDKARGEFVALRRLEPNFSLSLLRDPDYPAKGLQSAGCLAFNNDEFN